MLSENQSDIWRPVMNLSIVDISLVFGLIRDDQTSEKMGQWGQGGMCLKTEPWGGA